MSWTGRLRQASFRGVPFSVDAHEAELGRRVQIHEYPLRDIPLAEDLGRAARRFAVEALLVGVDYDLRRDALVRAAEAPGAGTLVHPNFGELQVQCLRARVREGTSEGGMARVSLEFVEVGAAAWPAEGAGTTAAVIAAGDSATSAAQDGFVKRYSVAGKPGFVAEAASKIVGGALTQISSVVGSVRGAADEAAALGRDLQAARADLTTLIYAPASTAQALVGSIKQALRLVATAPRDAWAMARTMFRFGADFGPMSGTTPSRLAQARNQIELVQLVRVTAAAEASRAVAQMRWATQDEAAEARDEIVETIDDAALVADDALFEALRALRVAVVRDVAARGADRARLARYTPSVTMPALLVAQLVYADGARAAELLNRNPQVRHPLFAPGARALEVLTDA